MAPRKEVNNSMCQTLKRKHEFIKEYFLEATSQIITETTDFFNHTIFDSANGFLI